MNNEVNVNGLIFQVEEAPSAFGVLPDKKWLEAELVNITKDKAPFGDVLKWYFELTDEVYSYEKGGEAKRREISGVTSFACNPGSKMYNWYSAISRSTPEVGESLNLKGIINSPCKIMAGEPKSGVKNPNNKFQNVIDVSGVDTPTIKQVVKPIQKTAAHPAAKPAIIPGSKAAIKSAPVKTKVESTSPEQIPDIFDDIQ